MSGASANQFVIRPEWLASHDEPVIDPDRPIIDAHHHLYDRPGQRYLLPDYLADLGTGHDIRGSVFVQARAMLRAGGPEALRAIGEVEFVNGIAAMSTSGIYGSSHVCSGIVGFADLALGDRVRPVLERLITAAGGVAGQGGRFCGIRQTLVWDRDNSLLNAAYPTSAEMIDQPNFREGFAHLARLGLSFDAWAFFPQLGAVERLARAFPATPIVLNHCGGIVRIHDYAEADTLESWRRGISDVARCPNVSVKLSGLGMRIGGFGFEDMSQAPSSFDLAFAWRPWVMHCLEAFGASRCMWGSNFPVDKGSYSLKVGVNAFKRLLADATAQEQEEVFARSAQRFYRLPSSIVE
ncbi:amidohydrolase family protein [Sphingobium sp. EP60837]|uniref:amidohydrolase family protein n=1 Tax=Sphingobium sp. EP60837 TaxID=1855519 RepID=UPI0007DD6F59|nr:amidohydrolase family protein [Sphingobium sp. EP60837]ANI80128.1 uncharacterized protein EP837_03746 [Sphingobium sp. EP60837]